jgi:O-antigen/teichoic acid export membrane protein
MNNINKLLNRLKVVSLFGISQVVSVLAIVLLSLIIIRFHSVELWGEYAEILIWTNVFLLFLSFGNNDYLLKLFSKNPSNINQQWTNNLFARSILLVPSLLLILFIPIFNHLELIIFIVILFKFLNQSFKPLIVFHRKFTLNICIESSYLLALIILVFYNLESLNLKLLLEIILLSQGLKLLIFSIALLKYFKHIKFQFQLLELKKSIPFFIPLAVGTFRSKIDAYYGTHFFSVSQLSKYQVFLSFLALTQMASTFAITPYLKNYYRSSNTAIKKTQKKFFVFGWGFAVVATVFMYVTISEIYHLDFTFQQYGLAFLFMIPLFLHVLLVSEYYKRDQQYKIAFFASIVVLFQIIIGYFLIKYWNINGALLLKLLGQWGIVIILWFWIKKQK